MDKGVFQLKKRTKQASNEAKDQSSKIETILACYSGRHHRDSYENVNISVPCFCCFDVAIYSFPLSLSLSLAPSPSPSLTLTLSLFIVDVKLFSPSFSGKRPLDRKRWTTVSAQVVSCCVYCIKKMLQHIDGNILDPCWVHFHLLKKLSVTRLGDF